MVFVDYKKFCNKCGVYKIECLVNHYCYIGTTTLATFTKRYTAHKNKLKKGGYKKKLQKDYDMYGEDNFEFSVILVSNDCEEIAQREKQEIAYYKALGLSYNVKSGGDTCYVSMDTRQVIAQKKARR